VRPGLGGASGHDFARGRERILDQGMITAFQRVLRSKMRADDKAALQSIYDELEVEGRPWVPIREMDNLDTAVRDMIPQSVYRQVRLYMQGRCKRECHELYPL